MTSRQHWLVAFGVTAAVVVLVAVTWVAAGDAITAWDDGSGPEDLGRALVPPALVAGVLAVGGLFVWVYAGRRLTRRRPGTG